MFYHCSVSILCTGILISPINAGFSFGGTYCALSTCEGSGQTWCDSGCCTEHGVTHCCPNLMMVIVGSVFGTLLVLLVALTLIVIYLRRRRSLKLHAISCEEPPVVRITRPESGQRQRHPPTEPPEPERQPQPPSDELPPLRVYNCCLIILDTIAGLCFWFKRNNSFPYYIVGI